MARITAGRSFWPWSWINKGKKVGLSEQSPENELRRATRSQDSDFGCGGTLNGYRDLWEGPMTLSVSEEAEGWNQLQFEVACHCRYIITHQNQAVASPFLLLFSLPLAPPIGRSIWSQLAKNVCRVQISAHKAEHRRNVWSSEAIA